MKSLFNDLIKGKYKNRGIISIIVLCISFFFLMGNYSTIRYSFKENQVGIQDSIINECFSMGSIEKFLFFLFLVWSVGFLFKEKESELKENLCGEEFKQKKYFFSKSILIFGVTLIPIVFNIFIKMIFYIPYRDIFSFDKLILSSLYFITLCILFTSIIFIMNFIVKDEMFAGIFPIFFVDGLILFFAVSKFLISDKLIFIRNGLNFIGEKILETFSLFNLDFQSSTFSYLKQIILLVILTAISALIIYSSYLLLKIINAKDLDKPYFFELPRHIIYIFMSIIIGFTVISAIGLLFIMFVPQLNYVTGTFVVNIVALLISVLLFICLEVLYKRNIFDEELVEKNISTFNEIQIYNEEFIEFDETTGFLENNILKECSEDEKEEISNNKNKTLSEVSNLDSEEEKILKDEFNKAFKEIECEEIDYLDNYKNKDNDEVYIDDTDDVLRNFISDKKEKNFH